MPKNYDDEEEDNSGSRFRDDDEEESSSSGDDDDDDEIFDPPAQVGLGHAPEQPLDNNKEMDESDRFNDDDFNSGKKKGVSQGMGRTRLWMGAGCCCLLVAVAVVLVLHFIMDKDVFFLKHDDNDSTAADTPVETTSSAPPPVVPTLPPPTTSTTPQPPEVNVVLQQYVDFSAAFTSNEMIEYLPIVLSENTPESGQRLLKKNKADVVRVTLVLPIKTNISDGDTFTHLNPETFTVDLSDVDENNIPTLGSTCPPDKGTRHWYDPKKVPESIDVDVSAKTSSAIVTCLNFKAIAISYHLLYDKEAMEGNPDGESDNDSIDLLPDDFTTTVSFAEEAPNRIEFGKATGLALLVAQSADDEFFTMKETQDLNETVSDRLLKEGLTVGDDCPPTTEDKQEGLKVRFNLPKDEILPGVAFLVLDGTHKDGRETKHVFLCDSQNNTISATVKFVFQADLEVPPTSTTPTTADSSTVETTDQPSTSALPSETTASSTPSAATSSTTSSTTIATTSSTTSSLNILQPGTTATTSTLPPPSTTPGGGNGPVVTYGLQPDCGANDPSKFNICLDISSKSGNVEPWFEDVVRAKEAWEDIINGDVGGPWQLSDIQNIYIDSVIVATGLPDIPSLDDMYIAVIEGSIDGAGGTWALAGPDLVLGDWEVVTGSMIVETEDIGPAMENDVWYPLMIHEFGHIIGVGNLWEYKEVQGSNTKLVDGGVYQGPSANAFWDSIGCSGPVPVHSSHWAEDCVDLEVMSPYFKFGKPWYISGLTMGAVEDLGYSVDRSLEMPFGMDQLGTKCGSFCPEKGNSRRLRTSTNYASASPEVQDKVTERAHQHFAAEGSHRQSVSVLFQQDDQVVSHIVQRHDIK